METSQHVKYNAFKYTLNSTPYWYVIDGTHEEWTDDLSSIGYSEVPSVVLPTVSEVTVYTRNEYHYYQPSVTNQTTTENPSYIYDLYTNSECADAFNYDSNSLYLAGYVSSGVWKMASIQSVLDMPSTTTPDGTQATNARIINSSGKMWMVSNFSNGTMSDGGAQQKVVCKVCSSNQATVITVYNSSNVAYNAFKYTASGTDYYYVLDGTQTDWVTDLSGIGYRDYIETTYYYYDKSYTSVSNNSWVYLYDNGTTTIPVDDVSKYEFVKYYTGSADTTGRDYGITLSVYNGKLTAKNTSGETIVLQRIDVRIHS